MQRMTTPILLLVLAQSPAAAELPACPGDCNGDSVVRIGELIRGVKAVLSVNCPIPEREFCPLDSCFFEDREGDGVQTIGDVSNAVGRLVRAVRRSLHGCDYEDRIAADWEHVEQEGERVLALIEHPQTCRDTSDCRYAGFGDKPCGGPWSYLIYSAIAVDEAELLAKIAAYNQLNEEYNGRYKVRSTCDRRTAPTVSCVEEICVDLKVAQ